MNKKNEDPEIIEEFDLEDEYDYDLGNDFLIDVLNLKLDESLAIEVPAIISEEPLRFNSYGSFDEFEIEDEEDCDIEEINEYVFEKTECQACGDFVESDNGFLICYGCLSDEVKSFVESVK